MWTAESEWETENVECWLQPAEQWRWHLTDWMIHVGFWNCLKHIFIACIIKLYILYIGEEDATKFLDCKIRGSSGGSTGAIIWDLEVVEHLFSEGKMMFVLLLFSLFV